MKQAFFLVAAIALAACQANGVTTSPNVSIASPAVSETKLSLTLVNGFGPTTTFLQQATCRKPFPFDLPNGGNGVNLGQGSYYGTQMTTAQTAPLCDGAKVNKFRNPDGNGNFTRILAGPIKIEYVCGLYILRRPHGTYVFRLGWPKGVDTACTVVQDTKTHATFTWNLK
ncbi:MAG TPA: hypothetical protein VHR97_00165 [Candidatus Baltobacteraceae bacterium]|jgi:hypothetical protein|nr:hypothetical protein [Candidatus Baltobacteraceae bacterium]